MQQLLPLFPFILQSKNDFEHQNKLLNKVTLTGKINADSTTVNLFEFADNTRNNFANLQNDLINILLQENLKTLTNELKSKAGVTIDILIRNLFERTADVGFLATDSQIIEFLTDDTISKEQIQKHLQEYIAKYSVYNEIIIFDTAGKVKANLNAQNKIEYSHDPLLKKTLQTNGYVEQYAQTDIFAMQEKTLTYTQKICNEDSKPIGILCLCFQFEDEMQRIFKNVLSEHESVLLIKENRIIASSDRKSYPLESYFAPIKKEYEIFKSSIGVGAKTSGYQGYYGLDFSTVVLRDTRTIAIEKKTQIEQHHFLNKEIQKIIDQADNIVDDLSDIIINGELIAAKLRKYLLNPILDNLRLISTNLLSTIKEAGNNLEALSQQSLKFNLISSSQLAIEIMDRNLYERANDSRWWAITPLFSEELAKKEPDEQKLSEVLRYINNLYTVYTNLFIYDTHGKIVASSNESEIIGKYIKNEAVAKSLKNRDSQKYFVSNFEKTEFYNNEATYIYHATIQNTKEVLGGIAVVFNSSVEFKAILDDSFTQNIQGMSLFIDENAMVIASTQSSIKVNSTFALDKNTLQKILQNDIYYGVITVEQKQYILASALSKGYREYKTSDNYTNRVISLTLLQIA